MGIAVHPDKGTYTIAGHLGSAPHVWIASLSADDTLRWSASYQSRPDGSGIEYANPTGLATLDGNGLLVSGYIGAPDVDAFLIRLADNGLPIWVKSYIAADSSEVLSGVIALRDGLIAFGRTQVLEEKNSYGDLWIVRANVDGGVRFTPGQRPDNSQLRRAVATHPRPHNSRAGTRIRRDHVGDQSEHELRGPSSQRHRRAHHQLIAADRQSRSWAWHRRASPPSCQPLYRALQNAVGQ